MEKGGGTVEENGNNLAYKKNWYFGNWYKIPLSSVKIETYGETFPLYKTFQNEIGHAKCIKTAKISSSAICIHLQKKYR